MDVTIQIANAKIVTAEATVLAEAKFNESLPEAVYPASFY